MNNSLSFPISSVELIQNPIALAVWAFMLSNPNNDIKRQDIMDRFSMGQRRYTNAMRELKQLGLVADRREYGERNQIIRKWMVCLPSPVK